MEESNSFKTPFIPVQDTSIEPYKI